MLIDNCGTYAGNFHKMYDDIIKQRMKDGKEVTPQDEENIDFLLFNAYKEILRDSPNEEIASDSLNNLQKMLSSGNVEILDIPKISKSINKQVVDDYNRKNKNEVDQILNDSIDKNYKSDISKNIATAIKAEIVTEATLSISESYKHNLQKISNSNFSTTVKQGLERSIYKAKNGDKTANREIMQTRIADEIQREVSIAPDYFKDETKRKQFFKRLLESKILGDKTAYKSYMEMAEAEGFSFVSRDKDGNLIDEEEELLMVAAKDISGYVQKYRSGELAEKLKRRNDIINKRTKPETLHDIKKLNDITNKSIIRKLTKSALEKAIEENDETEIQSIYELNVEGYKEVLKDKLKLCKELNINAPTSSKIQKLEKECMMMGEVLSKVNKEKEDSFLIPKTENSSLKMKQIKRDSEGEER